MNNEVIKAAAAQATASEVSEEELALINAYTRRPLTAEDVYVFSLTLCDNDVDRDGERFTVESLFALEKLFVGKTGIFDHEPSAKNQAARIFSCAATHDPDRKTALGDAYFSLKARAYMPKTEENRVLREMIDSGIVKEISVGCAVEKTLCSVCGQELAVCGHSRGTVYGDKLCCGELVNPTDAYEWSFVAVPAQRSAGVIKAANRKEATMEQLLKQLEENQSVTLSRQDCEKLTAYIGGLKQAAKDGVYYRDSLTAAVLRLSAAVQPDISRGTVECMTKAMSVAQLKEIRDAFEKQRNRDFLPQPQLCAGRTKDGAADASLEQFTI